MNKLGRDPYDLEDLLLRSWQLATHSEDPSTQLGAILIREDDTDHDMGDYILRGVNHLPAGTDKKVWKVREQKYRYVVHAECAVLNQARALEYPTHKSTLVCPWACCYQCAKEIVKAGVSVVVVDDGAMSRTPERWRDTIDSAHELLRENRVDIISLPTPKGKPETLFNGEVW